MAKGVCGYAYLFCHNFLYIMYPEKIFCREHKKHALSLTTECMHITY